MHWKALDLDPAQATATDVKRSYARLLKQCRPDQNPEGFKQLHDAYQTALAELEWRSNSSTTSDPTSTSATPEHARSEAKGNASLEILETVSHIEISAGAKSILRALDQLEDALKNNLPDVAERVRASETALFENPDEAPRWGGAVYRLIKIFADHPDLRLKPEAMLFELEHHSVAATVGVIDRLDQKENREAISNLARLFLKNKDRIRTPAGGIAASRLACAAAFLAKGQVGPLSDFAYETLARGERDFHMQLIDRHVSISGLLADVPISIRNFWRQRLIDGASRDAWDSNESSAALDWLGSSLGRRSNAF
nr:J domain-containing protein [Akkermansiaceae bacterium]